MRFRLLTAAILALLLAVLAACTDVDPRAAGPEAPERAAASTKPAGPTQFIVWSSRPIPAAIFSAARKIDGVLAVGVRRSEILDSRAAPGATRPVPSRPRGAVVPISVTAMDPSVLSHFAGLSEPAKALARGEAVVPAASAAFRGIEVGDAVELAGAQVARLRVGAIVSDRISRSEIVVGEQVGRRLGMDGRPSLVLAAKPGREMAVEAGLTLAIGTFPARVRSFVPEEQPAPPMPQSGGLISLLGLKRHFGEFWYRRTGAQRLVIDPAWSKANIVDARVPVLGVVRCHRRVIPLLTAALQEVERSALAGLIKSYDGCFNPRTQVADNDVISRHAYGVAIDINARTNGYGATPKLDMRIVEIFERNGFTWGGRWTVPDGMHFEFSRFPDATS